MVTRKPKNLLTEAPDPHEDDPTLESYTEAMEEHEERDKELLDDRDFRHTALEMYSSIEEGFEAQSDRADNNLDYWDIYNTELNENQTYHGNSQIYVPIVRDAINARVTRFSNQLFPSNKRNVEVISNDEHLPNGIMALMEHYIRKTKCRTEIVPALIRAGDIEGQYTVYVSWRKVKRTVLHRVKKQPKGENGIGDPSEEIDDIEEKVIVDSFPKVELISDNDLLVLPATSDTIDEALDAGGSVTVIRRWGKGRIKRMIKAGDIDKEAGRLLLEEFDAATKDGSALGKKDVGKHLADSAGIHKGARGKFALIYETWAYMTSENEDGDEERRLYRVYFGGSNNVLSIKRNPFWCDLLPVISAPIEKEVNVFKGKSLVSAIDSYQYNANDIAMEGMDSAAFSMLPIVMTDPEKNPRIGSMILSLAAIWQTSPKDTQFAEFPKLYEQAFEIINAMRQQIMQTMSVNPAMITQSTQTKKKPNQAEVAQEQAVDILTTANAVTILEEGILTPMLRLFMELDHQYRDEKLSVRAYGPLAARAAFEHIEPIAMDNRYSIRWFGVEQARTQAQVQQQIAALNVLRGFPPQLYMPYKTNYAPVLLQLVENVFGPRLAPLIFEDVREQMGLPVEMENEMLAQGIPVMPHPMDNHKQHIQQHQQAMQENRDAHGTFAAHIAEHTISMQMAQQQAMQAQTGQPGSPGGDGPGGPGQPRMGAQNKAPRGGQGPAGMIHKDQMGQGDSGAFPRR